MATPIEWVIKNSNKFYPICHAKATVVGDDGNLDDSLSTLETEIEQIQSDFDSLQGLSNLADHISAKSLSETGTHGFRYYNDALQYTTDGENWSTIGTTSGGIPPMGMRFCDACESSTEDTTVVLKGVDPEDTKSYEGETLVKWQGTKIVRKVGSYPKAVNDGTLVVDYQVRNQYKTTGFKDTGLTAGTTYYYRWFPYSDQGAINMSSDESINRCKVTLQTIEILGVTVDLENNTFTRTDSSVGLSAGSNFDSYKMFGQRRRCIVADDRTILAFYGDEAYTETGKLTTEVTKNGTTYAVGTSVQVMVYQPKFYYKVTPTAKEDNPYGTGYLIRGATYQVSNIRYDGFKVHPAFIRNEVEYPYILMSAFEACTQDSSDNYITDNTSLGNRLASIAGALPATSGIHDGSSYTTTHILTRPISRTLATARGTGWQLQDILMLSCTQLLFLIEYATMNSQTAIGNGNISTTGNYGYTAVIATGGTSSLGNASGSTEEKSSVTQSSVTYRGEENLWGNVTKWIDGINFDAYHSVYVAESGYKEASTDSPYSSTGIRLNSSSGYISSFGYSESAIILP